MINSENATVTIEVSPEFGAKLQEGKYITFNKAYGIGSRYYDIECEVGTDLWRKCLWNQVDLYVTGMTEAEFMLPMYSWLHRLIPTNLGSNRQDVHSAFCWENSFSIEKTDGEIHLNGGESAYTLSGRKIKSPMEKEIESAIPKAPKGHPFVKKQSDEYGTTVSLGGEENILSGDNVVILNSPDIGGIKKKYSGTSEINWSTLHYHVAYVQDLSKPAYVECQTWCLNNDLDMGSTFYWYFPNKKRFIEMGSKRSYELMIKFGMSLPEWLKERFENHIPKQGNGWRLIN